MKKVKETIAVQTKKVDALEVALASVTSPDEDTQDEEDTPEEEEESTSLMEDQPPQEPVP